MPKPRMCPAHPKLDRGAKGLAERIHVNLLFPSLVQPCILMSNNAASHNAFNYGEAKTRSPSPEVKNPHQSVAVHGGDEQKKCENGYKWVKMGKHPKTPYPQCGRSSKTYAKSNNDAPSITKYGSPIWLDAQIFALHLNGVRVVRALCPPYPLYPDTLTHLRLYRMIVLQKTRRKSIRETPCCPKHATK